ncbi:hypothetical protein IJ579_07595 [bacterium]|nr:hypothetical protein [bacterium]
MGKNSDLLAVGIVVLIIGVLLLAYSASSYTEIRALKGKIDFYELENNNRMPDSEKYTQFLMNADYLNKKLDQNKNLIIKNAACAYADYAQHNAIGLYHLTQSQADTSKKTVAQGNMRSLYSVLSSYKSCKNTNNYRMQLQQILDSEDKINDFYEQDKINTFINGKSYVEQNIEDSPQNEEESYTTPTSEDTMQTGGTY